MLLTVQQPYITGFVLFLILSNKNYTKLLVNIMLIEVEQWNRIESGLVGRKS